MAKIELQETPSYLKCNFEPVEMEDGTIVNMDYVVEGEKKTMNGKALKDSKEVALFRVNPDGNRLFIQVQPLDGVSIDTAADIVETFVEGIRHLFNKE